MIDIAISFDMTGSMAPCIYQLRCEINKFMTTLASHLTDMQIGIITHGDYDSSSYVVQYLDLTSDIDKAKNFITTINTAGANSYNDGEAYEEALKAANHLSWREHSIKTLIVIGDDIPHPPDRNINRNKLDWKVELANLHSKGIKTYGVQCPMLDVKRSAFFYKALSENTLEGHIITMNQFSYVVDIIIALAFTSHNEHSVKTFEDTLIKDNKYNRNLEQIFNTLLKREDENKMTFTTPKSTRSIGTTIAFGDPNSANLVAVAPSRFQMLTVQNNIDIKTFVNMSGATFKIGRGFYELTKRELITPKKEIIVQHITSGEMFNGDGARVIMGIPANDSVYVKNVPAGYRAFVQSTSVNRKLIGGTNFLYEVEN